MVFCTLHALFLIIADLKADLPECVRSSKCRKVLLTLVSVSYRVVFVKCIANYRGLKMIS